MIEIMKTMYRHEFKNQKDMIGWINTSGSSHIESSEDIFIRPVKWGLFRWNKENNYPINNAISLHDKEVTHNEYVCRPVEFE